MAWLLRAEEVLAALDPPSGGLLVGAPEGPAALLERTAVVHTLEGCPGLDLAWCRLDGSGPDTGSLVVRRTALLGSRRAVVARPGTGAVVVARSGAFERWTLRVGDVLRIERT